MCMAGMQWFVVLINSDSLKKLIDPKFQCQCGVFTSAVCGVMFNFLEQ